MQNLTHISDQNAVKTTRNELTSRRSLELRNRLLVSKEEFVRAISFGDKEVIREAHLRAKRGTDGNSYKLLLSLLEKHRAFFADSIKIDPTRIRPVLVEVESRGWTAELFRLARATWSMPHNKGYGKRIRYLVMDEYHNKLMGVIGLQSPPADLKCRDILVEKSENKLHWVNMTLDAYTVGAVPPYNNFLGGKLVAGYLASVEIQQKYWEKYGVQAKYIGTGKSKQPLIAVTTASAFGRSSIYNRLKMHDRSLLEPIGYTRGFGAIHIEKHYPEIIDWLKTQGECVPPGFGQGPKVKWQNVNLAARKLGLGNNFLHHGLERQVFIARHVKNLSEVAAGKATPIPFTIKGIEWAEFWKDRYCLPRISRNANLPAIDGCQSVLSAISMLKP